MCPIAFFWKGFNSLINIWLHLDLCSPNLINFWESFACTPRILVVSIIGVELFVKPMVEDDDNIRFVLLVGDEEGDNRDASNGSSDMGDEGDREGNNPPVFVMKVLLLGLCSSASFSSSNSLLSSSSCVLFLLLILLPTCFSDNNLPLVDKPNRDRWG